jgi:hypothetical protein
MQQAVVQEDGNLMSPSVTKATYPTINSPAKATARVARAGPSADASIRSIRPE